MWEINGYINENAGQEILSDKDFFNQLVEMIKKEEDFLKNNPEHMVMYHAAENNVLQIYYFINLWKQMLMQQKIGNLPVIQDMRIYDFIKKSFDKIEMFLAKMRKNKSNYPDEPFNNIPGFQERAIACNPSLISNSHSTASSSLWWYFKSKNNTRLQTKEIIATFLKILGIDSEERVEDYINLFKEDEEQSQVPDLNNALMQQFFVPYDVAKQSAYMCQIWGEEFFSNELNLSSPDVMKKLIAEPDQFESSFREPRNKIAVRNFGNCPTLSEEISNFRYSGLLQIRYLPGMNDNQTFSYFRNLSKHNGFVKKLLGLISKDFKRHLSSDTLLPETVFNGSLLSSLRLIHKKSYNLEVIFEKQRQLYLGLVENPRAQDYEDITTVSKEEKIRLQERLRETPLLNTSNIVFPFSLCRDLKGYAYFDLIEEALRKKFLESDFYTSPKIPEDLKIIIKGHYDETIAFIKKFSTPDSIDTAWLDISSESYARYKKFVEEAMSSLLFDASKHYFFVSEPRYCDDYLWSFEKGNAIECAFRNARLAKEKVNGHSIDHRFGHVTGL